MERLLVFSVLLTAIDGVSYTVSSVPTKPILDTQANLRCQVSDIDPAVTDYVIVWYQERTIYEALIRPTSNQLDKRIVAICRTVNGASNYTINSPPILPNPSEVTNRLCDQSNSNIRLDVSGMQHIGDWYCYFTAIDGTEPLTIGSGEITVTNENLIRSNGQKLSIITTAPNENLSPGSYAGIISASAVIPCNADTTSMNPPIKYSWERPTDMKMTNKGRVGPDGSLNLTYVAAEDAGSYTCTAISNGITTSATITFITYALPNVTIRVDDYFMTFVVPKCPTDLTWVFYAVKLDATDYIITNSMTAEFPRDNNQFSYPLQYDRAYDDGTFFVKTFAYLPGIKPFPLVTVSNNYTIHVQYAPDSVLLQPPPGFTKFLALEGKGRILDCNSRGGGYPSTPLLWSEIRRDGSERLLGAGGYGVQWTTEENVGQPRKGISRLYHVYDRSSNGSSLLCYVEGYRQLTNLTSQVPLTVFWVPDVMNFSVDPSNTTLLEGSNVTFECYAIGGYPNDVIVAVTYEGRSLQMYDNKINLYDITDANSGTYTCTASSLAGVITRVISLAVLKKPVSIREALGPLLGVLLVVAFISAIIAAVFIYFKLRPLPENAPKKPRRVPRFRPSKEMRAEKKQRRLEATSSTGSTVAILDESSSQFTCSTNIDAITYVSELDDYTDIEHYHYSYYPQANVEKTETVETKDGETKNIEAVIHAKVISISEDIELQFANGEPDLGYYRFGDILEITHF